jgi:hypothetical protein
MSTQIKWNASGSREVAAVARPKWREVRQGLVLALMGHILLLGPGLLGLVLIGPLADRAPDLVRLDETDSAYLAKALLACGAGLGYLLLLLGQWRCLTRAPQGHGAKDLQFACLLCSLLVPLCFLTAHYLGGTATYTAFRDGLSEMIDLDPLNPGVLLQILGVVLGVLAALLFSGFTGALARCLGANKGGVVNVYFWFVAFLLGGTVGVVLQVRRYVPPDVLRLLLLVLVLSWLFAWLWHVMILGGAARRITRFLRDRRSGSIPLRGPLAREKGQVTMKTAEYLYKKA